MYSRHAANAKNTSRTPAVRTVNTRLWVPRLHSSGRRGLVELDHLEPDAQNDYDENRDEHGHDVVAYCGTTRSRILAQRLQDFVQVVRDEGDEHREAGAVSRGRPCLLSQPVA